MDLNDVKKVVDSLLAKYELKKRGWKFKFDRALKRFGCCKMKSKVLTLSKLMTELNLEYNYSEIYDVILHEVAHAITVERYGTNVQPHGKEWRQICLEIGGSAERLYDSKLLTTVQGKFTLVCPHCGEKYYFHKKPSVENACGKCCKKYNRNKFDKKYVLIFKEPTT